MYSGQAAGPSSYTTASPPQHTLQMTHSAINFTLLKSIEHYF